jgi:hypothetical protein
MHDLMLLAQQAVYDRGLLIFQLGLTGFGAGLLIAAAGVVFAKPKAPEKELSTLVKAIAATAFAGMGIGIVCYAWLAF